MIAGSFVNCLEPQPGKEKKRKKGHRESARDLGVLQQVFYKPQGKENYGRSQRKQTYYFQKIKPKISS